jgi:predicted RecA/RadA family phage recombinase
VNFVRENAQIAIVNGAEIGGGASIEMGESGG